MKKYFVLLTKHTDYYVTVEAENEKQAKEIALGLSESDLTEDDTSEWTVELTEKSGEA